MKFNTFRPDHPNVVLRRRRLARLKRKGLHRQLTKRQARALCQQAYAEWAAKNPKF